MMEEKLNIEYKKEYRTQKKEYEKEKERLDGMILNEIRRNILAGNNSMEIHAVIKVFVIGDEIQPKILEVETVW